MTKYLTVSAACLLFSISAINRAHAGRGLSAVVEVDGQIVLQTDYHDDDNPHQERVWRYLTKPGSVRVAKIEANPDDPLRADLKGDIVIRIVGINASAKKLTLIQSDSTSDRWHLPEEEVERIGIANRIGKPRIWHLSESEWANTILISIVTVLTIVVALGLVWLTRIIMRKVARKTA